MAYARSNGLNFGKAKSTINEHIKSVYEEKELEESTTIKKFGNSEFQQKAFNYYNLDVLKDDIDIDFVAQPNWKAK